MKIKILRIKLSLMIVVMLLSILSYSQTAKTTYNFSTAASLSFGSGGFGIWYTQADITIDGTAYRLTSGGNGSFSNLSSGGVSNSACLKKDGSGGDQFTLQRVDGQPFQFYGIWVNHQSMNLYSTLGLTLPPWYTLTASTFSFQDNTPMTAGTNWDNYTYSTQTISAGTNGVTTTSVSIVFPAIIYYSIDDIIVGPVPSIASTVTTQAVSNINATTATGNGNITSLGSPNPTAYGICWNTTGTPTTANSKVDKGAASATGAFTASMTGLAAGTTYYVRAFATNNAGTSYGSQVSFTTTSTLPAISSFTPTSACPGTTITISGTNFTGASSVSFGGTEATSFSVVNATTITAVVANGTSGSVSVTTAEGTGTKTGFTMKPSIPGTLTYNSAIGALTMVSDGQAGSIDYCGITLNVYGANSGLSILTNAMTYEANIYPGVNGLAANYLSGEGSDYIIIKSSDNSVNFSLQSLQLIDYGGNDVKIEGFDNSSPTGSINYITNVNPWYFTLTQSGALTPSKFQDIDEVRISGQSGGPIWIAINNIQLSTPVSTPIVSSVSVPTNATYIIGQNLDFTVNFSAAVTVVTTGGTPYIPITLNTGGTVNATYVSGSGTTALVFRYTVASGNLDNNGVSVGTAIIANGGTLKNAGSTDANLILNSVGSTTGVLVDGVRPTATIVVADNALIAGETSLVTITFSEAVTGFTNADLTISNGTLSAVSSGDGGVTWTATFTPAASLEDATNVITLNITGIADAAGNAGTGATNSNNYTIDTLRPTASIVVADNALIAGETSLVTITFSEAVSGFTNADLTIANGTLSSVSSGDGGVTWTATLTPTASVEDATNVITLDNTGVSDASGNSGTGTTNSNNYAIDTKRPTASIVVADNALIAGETSLVTITFSEAVSGFTNADLTIANGTLSSVSSGDGGVTWTGTFTPAASLEDATNVITLDNTGVSDASGNAGTGATNSNNYAIDTLRPTASIVVADNALIAGETSLVTITFSEAVTGFTNADLTIANGTLSSVSSGDGGVTWTATLTPTASVEDATNLITLDNTGVSDASGNSGTGATNSNNYAIDTLRPTASIVVADNALIAGETSLVTITFSEAVSGFTNADLTIANGTLSAVSSGDGGVTWTATFTPAASLEDATNVITLDNTGVSDASGNAGIGTSNSNNYAIDTKRPTASIVVADNALIAGETTLVTITFSEAVTGFTNADLTIANGTLSSVSSGDGGVTWTATLTPTASVEDATNVITLDNTGVSDASGNSGTGTTNSNNYAIDTKRPTASIVVADNALIAGETSLVTITFSEAVTGFTNADLTIANGTLSAVSSGDGGVTWTATLTPAASLEDATNVITLDNTGVSDASGNSGTGTTNSNNYAIDTNPPSVINVTSSTSNGIYKASDIITILITYSEPVTITGTPTLSLNSGGSASYASGTTTATLTFNYTVGNGQSTTDLDYLSTTALILEGGTIADAAGNDGILTLPTVGGLNSIGGQKDIVIKSGQNITFNALPTKIYGDANFTPSATSSSGLTVTFTTSDSNVATIVGGQIHIVGAGTCTIFADQIGNSTYLAAAQESQALTVNKATLTVSADTQTKIYGEANPTLTFVYSGWQNGDDADDLTTKPTASTTVTVTSPAAVYSNAITVSGGVDENYDFTYVPANLEVTKAMLTVTADAKIKGYDSPIPPLTFKYSGWENGDDASVLATPPTMTTTVTVATPVGKYPNSIIGIGGSDVNYDFTFIAADFEVTKANQAITFAVLPSKTYGDPAFDLVANTNSGLKTSFASSNPNVAQVSGNKLTIVGAGATTITAIQEGTNNFNAAPSVSHSFVVNRKVVVVENATAVSKEYDGTATAVVQGSSLSGIINADEVILENESGTFAQITAGINIAVSTAMTLSGEKAGNYELAQPSGLKADILKKEITVTAEPISKACSENDPVFTYRYAPELVGPDSFTGALSREVGTSVGTYAIVQGSLSLSGNYQLIYQGADFTITDSAPVWITAPMALNMTLEYADVAGLLAAQSLVPEAFDACDNILPAPVKISGEFVKVADCNHVGNYVNTWTVTDHSGNVSNEYTQVITLVDRIIPKIQELPSIVLTVAPGVCETKINYPEIKVFDDCIGTLELKSGLGKDGLFPVGTTMETWEVTDQSGNTATAYFAVTVKSYNEAPKVDLIDDLSVAKYTKEVEVPLSGIDPTSGCTLQEIVSITAEADDKLLISEVLVDYSKGSTTGKLILTIADKAEGETMIRVTVKDNGGVENGGSDTRIMTFMVKIDRPTGLTDLSQNIAAEVYPNPSHGKVNVVVTGALTSTVRIVSVAGVEVYKNTRVTDSVLNVDLSKSLAGIYFVEISDGKKSIVKKLILRN